MLIVAFCCCSIYCILLHMKPPLHAHDTHSRNRHQFSGTIFWSSWKYCKSASLTLQKFSRTSSTHVLLMHNGFIRTLLNSRCYRWIDIDCCCNVFIWSALHRLKNHVRLCVSERNEFRNFLPFWTKPFINAKSTTYLVYCVYQTGSEINFRRDNVKYQISKNHA